MPGNIVGEAFVAIRPDLTGFASALTAGLTESIAKGQALADTRPIKVRVVLDTSEAIAQFAILRAAAGGVGGGGGGITGAAAGAAAGGGGGNGGFLTGVAAQKILGVGAGSSRGLFGLGAGLAGAFSILSFAGLGVEHVLTTILGLVGSLAGAIGGGLLLAIGAAGVAFTGMGIDAVVMKSTIADTKTLYQGLTAIRTAVIQYGKGSAQAVAAQQALNTQIKLLGNTAGVAAELSLAKSLQALNQYWDKATSAARVAAVGLIKPFLSIAYTFIPLINKAATTNFTIMTAAFRPLIAWLNGPQGIGVFTQLETVFAHNLPTAIHAFTQFVEITLRSLGFLSSFTGGLTKKIDEFLTHVNGPGWANWINTMSTLIGMFHTWWDLIKEFTKVVIDFFKLTAGLGTSIVSALTGMLTKLDAWLNLTTTKTSLHNLFQLHKQEVLDLLALLPSLFSSLGTVYLTLAPLLTGALVGVLGVLVNILKAITSNAWGAWLVGIGLILAKMSLLGGALAIAKTLIGQILGLGGGAAASATSAKTGFLGLGGGIQKVYVVNWAQIGAGGGATSAVEGAATSGGLLSTVGRAALGGFVAAAAAITLDSFFTLLTHKLPTGLSVSGTGTRGANGQNPGLARFGNLSVIGPSAASIQNMANINALIQSLASIVGHTVPQIGTGFITLENHLTAMGLSFSKAVSATDALQGYIQKYGPLTSTQMLAFYDDVKHGVTSAFDIWLSLQTVNENLQPAVQSAAGIAAALAKLHRSIPGTINITGGGKGFFATGGFIPPGSWGIAGDQGPEPVFGGQTGVTVLPHSQMPRATASSTNPILQQVNNFFGLGKETDARIQQQLKANNQRLMRLMRAGARA